MKKIVIFGTGSCGKKIYDFLSHVTGEKTVAFFCRTNAAEHERFCGLRVISPHEIEADKRADLIVMIAVYDRKTAKEIKRMLLGMDFTAQQLMEINSFLLDNVIADFQEDTADGSYYCLCCKNRIRKFLPAGERHSGIFERFHIIGGGYREESACPVCGALDRTRWQQYVLEHFTEILHKRCNVLHIAPEDALYRFISSNRECDYYTGDIEIGRAQHLCDLTDLQFKDDFFDYMIANHVLEHIKRIDLAFDEIRRVLKKEGKLILSFPICTELRTSEESIPLSEEERLKRFGQKDHVRLFGYDYKEYIEKFGFLVNTISPRDILDSDVIHRNGFLEDDVILICSKR